MAYQAVFVCFVVSLVAPVAFAMIPSIEDYFPDLDGDLTKLTWLHAVNNQSLLDQALQAPGVHMLEADVVYGMLEDGSGPMPVMAHPPANTSNLSLQAFVEAVIKVQSSSKKGMKLDFKFDKAYNESWQILDKLRSELTFPVWINADILQGPGSSVMQPLDARNLVSLARDHLPEAMLSLGWTTAWQVGVGYSDEMLNAMQQVVEEEQVKQPVTLAVRAAFAALSTKGIQDLVSAIDSFQKKNQTTITIWMSTPADVVDIKQLRSLLLDLGRRRVALDVPERIRNQLVSASPVTAAEGALVAVLSSVTVAFNRIANLF